MSDKDIALNVGCTPLTVRCVFDPAAKEKRATRQRKYYHDNPEKCSKTARKSYINNREKQLADVNSYRKSDAGKEKIRQYRIDNKDSIKRKK